SLGDAMRALQQATSTIPIVFALAADPVGSGLVDSLPRPGGNITGLSSQQIDIAGKRVELLREMVPHLRRLAIIANTGEPRAVLEMRETQAAARKLGIEPIAAEIRQAGDLIPAMQALKGRAEALYVVTDHIIATNSPAVHTLSMAAGLPAMYNTRDYVERGGLISYGPNWLDLFRPAADYVDKILRGAKPADLPVEQPTKFDLIINLTTAKALGLTIPESFLLRANEIIE